MKTVLPDIYVTTTDFERLTKLLASYNGINAAELEEELGRAQVVPDSDLPFSIVTMNSTVSFQDLDTQKVTTVTLVYPEEANVTEQKVSVLAPVGIALLGLQLNEVIEWPVPNGQSRKLRVVAISNEVERAS